MSEAMIKKVDQAAMVVKDAQAAARYLSDVFGIGPWFCLQFGDAGQDGVQHWAPIDDCICEGERIGTYSIDCCCCAMENGVEIELISPKAGASLFDRYLKRHGAGGQHISIVIDDYDEAIARMKEAGFENGQTATVAQQETCAFVDHTAVLGTYLELHKRPPVMKSMEDDELDLVFIPGPEADTKPLISPVLGPIEEMTVVTGNLEASLQILEGAYGLGPWERTETDLTKTAVCGALNLRIRLEEPLCPESYGAALLKKNGTDVKSFTMRQIGALPGGIEARKIDGADCIDLSEMFGVLIELKK